MGGSRAFREIPGIEECPGTRERGGIREPWWRELSQAAAMELLASHLHQNQPGLPTASTPLSPSHTSLTGEQARKRDLLSRQSHTCSTISSQEFGISNRGEHTSHTHFKQIWCN